MEILRINKMDADVIDDPKSYRKKELSYFALPNHSGNLFQPIGCPTYFEKYQPLLTMSMHVPP